MFNSNLKVIFAWVIAVSVIGGGFALAKDAGDKPVEGRLCPRPTPRLAA